jgi:hypothetical protein
VLPQAGKVAREYTTSPQLQELLTAAEAKAAPAAEEAAPAAQEAAAAPAAPTKADQVGAGGCLCHVKVLCGSVLPATVGGFPGLVRAYVHRDHNHPLPTRACRSTCAAAAC